MAAAVAIELSMDDHIPHPPATDPLGARSATALRDCKSARRPRFRRGASKSRNWKATSPRNWKRLPPLSPTKRRSRPRMPSRPRRSQAEIKRLTAELEDAQAAAKLERAAWESEREALEKERAVPRRNGPRSKPSD